VSTGAAIAIIPSRFAAARLPGKPLAEIAGRPMIAWVVERCAQARRVGRVVVATDDDRIARAALAAGAEAMRTDPGHRSGSDRVAEAVRRLDLPGRAAVVNVQGDEPLIDPASIDAVLAALELPGVERCTAAAPLLGDPAEPARVKVVTDAQGDALYFSRAPIPSGGPYRLHLGLYAFRVEALLDFADLPPGLLEQQERLEQLRLLEHGRRLRVVPVDRHSPSVDTPEDLALVRSLVRPS
jgi:3-deoxy-manno-octulosonate cytidylyltransferase (CMP-KDO synthetase)